MIRHRMHYAVATALVASLALAGCKKDDAAIVATPVVTSPAPTPMTLPDRAPDATALSVTTVDMGNAVGADNRVTSAMSTFAPADTLYTSVTTMGNASNVPLTVRWTYQDGQQVGTETKTINSTGATTTEFHASKPGGWPAGNYKAEVMLNGASVQTRDFSVR